ncbi:unnamed protein product [Heterobilharzia americana]|nr:unnamed protein product [Heterobilharzia americana]CAH8550392.1 unnamed protein product [Heterobilharzia americana]
MILYLNESKIEYDNRKQTLLLTRKNLSSSSALFALSVKVSAQTNRESINMVNKQANMSKCTKMRSFRFTYMLHRIMNVFISIFLLRSSFKSFYLPFKSLIYFINDVYSLKRDEFAMVY